MHLASEIGFHRTRKNASAIYFSAFVLKSLHSDQLKSLIKAKVIANNHNSKTVSVAERSKARVYGRSSAGTAGSNPAGGMDCFPL